MSSFPLNVLRLALKSNNNHGSHPVPADFFTPWLAGAQIPAWGGLGPFLARPVTRSPRRHTGSHWNKSHPKSAETHFARAGQNILPWRCWNEPHARKAASPIDSTSRFTACARAGHRLRPRAIARSQATTTPPPAISTKTKAGKGIRTLDIQLGKLTLYQLSYARITVGSLSIQPDASLHNPGPSRQVRARPRDTRPGPM